MKQRRSNIAIVGRVLRLAWKIAPRALIAYLVASAISALTLGGAVFLIRALISGTLGGTLSWRVGLALAGLIAAQQACAAVTEKEAAILRQRTSADINREIQEVLPNVPYSSFESTAFQAEYGMLVREASFRPTTLIDSMLQGALGIFTVLAILIALLPILPVAGLVLLALIVPVTYGERKLRGQMLNLQTYHAPDLLRMQYISQSSIDPDWQRDLRACNSDVLRTEYTELSRRYLRSLSTAATRIQRIRFLTGMSSLVIFGALFFVVAEAVTRHSLSAANTITLITGGFYLISRVGYVSASVGYIVESADFMSRLFQFLDNYSSEREEPVTVPATASPIPASIRLIDVTYAYPNSTNPALSNVSVTIGPGVTAVIGANGAGKSTLVKILVGMIPPSAGRVEIVDQEGRIIDAAALRVAVMFQNPAQLRLTVRQNVTMEAKSPPDADDQIWEVLESVGLGEAIRGLPQGLDSVLGGGFGAEANLSGGQWQRLVLARTLYRDAQLIVLDEPSSHLDAAAEGRLLEVLTAGLQQRIVVVVTHRRETLQACGRYLELADGKLATMGKVASRAFPSVMHPYLGPATSIRANGTEEATLEISSRLQLNCSFCGRSVGVASHALAQPDAVICAECAQLAVEVLGEVAGPDNPGLMCSFCGSAEPQTVPGPDGVAICASCAVRWQNSVLQ